MSKIDSSEVHRIAKLARIGLTEAEAASMAVELGQIVDFVEQLQKVDIDGVAPTDQVTGLVDVWREDEVMPSMPRDQVLANTPKQQDGFIVVKKVMNG